MTSTDHIRRALGSWVFATLIAFVPINLVGFASPFVAHLRGDPTASRALLESVQGYAPLLSLAYLWPAWHLSRAQSPSFARGAVLVAAVLVSVAWWIGALARREPAVGDGPLWTLVPFLTDLWISVATLGFVWLCSRGLRAPTVTQERAGGS